MTWASCGTAGVTNSDCDCWLQSVTFSSNEMLLPLPSSSLFSSCNIFLLIYKIYSRRIESSEKMSKIQIDV